MYNPWKLTIGLAITLLVIDVIFVIGLIYLW